MTTLEVALATVPVVYAELEAALVPGGGGGGERVSGGTRTAPADPARLEVVEHRHKLLRGLRWWVDAVADDTPHYVGDSPARMCVVILDNLRHMDPDDRAELRANLDDWLHDAYPHVGVVEQPRGVLPLEALSRVVPQSVAAKALGVHPTTVLRRAGGVGGPVKLADVAGPKCPATDLPAAWCAHCCAQ